MRVTIHVCSRDRHSELGLLVQSLRTQTFQDWDLIVLDSASGSPIQGCQFLNVLFNELKQEGHSVRLYRENNVVGVCRARNRLIELDDLGNEFVCRLDDDVILEPDYLERLLNVINQGFDIASGVTPNAGMPCLERETRFLGDKINVLKLDEEGNILEFGDDCGFTYDKSKVLSADHFRSCALYKSEIQKKVKYPEHLSFVGFREESWFSLNALRLGYKIGVDTKAKVVHLRTPSGGVRVSDYAERVKIDEEEFQKFVKKLVKDEKFRIP